MDKKGIVLIAIIFLIIFMGIAMFGVTTFIAQRLVGYNSEQTIARCRYNAEAGVAYAIYQYRSAGTQYSNTLTIDSTNSATVSTVPAQASAVIIDAAGSSLANSSRRVVNWTVRNNSASAIAINEYTVTWHVASRTFNEVQINGTTLGSTVAISTSPAVVAVSPTFSIPANTTYSSTMVRFNSNMSTDTGITISFKFTDGSITTPCTVYPAQGSTCTQPLILNITSTGKTADPKYYKTVVATYNTLTGKITAYTVTN